MKGSKEMLRRVSTKESKQIPWAKKRTEKEWQQQQAAVSSERQTLILTLTLILLGSQNSRMVFSSFLFPIYKTPSEN
jgi:hypothetical protein